MKNKEIISRLQKLSNENCEIQKSIINSLSDLDLEVLMASLQELTKSEREFNSIIRDIISEYEQQYE